MIEEPHPKLFTTVRTALKGYHDLCVINCNRQGLTKILDAAPTLYHPESLHDFFDGVLTQVIGLCNLGKGSCVTTVHNGAIVTTKNEKTVIQSCRGSFSHDNKERRKKLELCAQAMMRGEPAQEMPENVHLIPLEFGHEHFGLICLEYDNPLEKLDEDLVRIMVNQSASALKTINLYDDLKDAHRQAVRMLAIATEFRDKETGEHINRIQHNTIKVAMKLGLSAEVAEKYGIASILHDIGKVAIPDTILHKPERLTEEEFKIIQKHSGIGLAILKNGDWFELAQQIAYSHHERWDGGGYPVGLKGEEIPLAARIVSVVDVFDALTHKRIYKSAWTDEDAVEEIRCGAGTQFDPVVVLAFTTLWKKGALSENQGDRDE